MRVSWGQEGGQGRFAANLFVFVYFFVSTYFFCLYVCFCVGMCLYFCVLRIRLCLTGTNAMLQPNFLLLCILRVFVCACFCVCVFACLCVCVFACFCVCVFACLCVEGKLGSGCWPRPCCIPSLGRIRFPLFANTPTNAFKDPRIRQKSSPWNGMHSDGFGHDSEIYILQL